MMKWSELEATGCKEHLNEKQLPGVCSYCLRDKLSQLHNKNLVGPLYCSPSPSSPASPSATVHHYHHAPSSNHGYSNSLAHHRRRFRRNASHATGSAASCMISFNYGLDLRKSRSLAFASRNRIRERDHVVVGGGRGRKKDGFWSKVLKLTRKDTDESVVKSRAWWEGPREGWG